MTIRPWPIVGWGLLAGFVALNIVAYRQAYAMLHFTRAGDRTKAPEAQSRIEKLWTLIVGCNFPRPFSTAQPGLPFETKTLVAADGLKLEAWLIPANPSRGVVLLFHGYGACKAHLLAEAEAFHGMGYTALLVDFRGSGGSDGDMTSIGYHESKDVRAALDFARSAFPVQRIILFGQSMGAVAILRAMTDGKEPADAVILESVFDSMLQTTANRFRSMGLPAFPFAHLLVFWGSVQTGNFQFRHNPVDYAKSVRIPALMLHGELDPRATLAQARRVFDALSSPDKEFVPFAGLGHESCLAGNPTLWQENVAAFLAKRPRSHPPPPTRAHSEREKTDGPDSLSTRSMKGVPVFLGQGRRSCRSTHRCEGTQEKRPALRPMCAGLGTRPRYGAPPCDDPCRLAWQERKV